MFSRWFEEIASDFVAFCVTGPAIFFSLSDFFQLVGGGYGLSDTHPSSHLRRKLLFSNLQHGGDESFCAVFQRYTDLALSEDFNSPLLMETPPKEKLFPELVSKFNDPGPAAVLSELHDFMPLVSPLIFTQVMEFFNKNAPQAIYTPTMYQRDLQMHLSAMLAAIPPIEAGHKLNERIPTDFSSIINVGWVALLTKLPELRVKTSEDPFGAEKLERLHGLLLKAVELAEARRRWDNV